jgi:2-polyprenyl-3-methyl-5-hydroxy-6-metoxy-1,4-benzoquinol methylase
MIEITTHDRFYWKYEYEVVAKHLIPLMEKWGIKPSGLRMLDIGCGDGGGLAALYDAGMVCKGYDVEPRRVELAHQMMNGRSMTLIVGNIYDNPMPFSDEKFDLVVLHDVFEHIERKEEILRALKSYLTLDGKLFITFPPYYSAFGAHQQLLRTWFVRLPFIHLLPFMVSIVYTRLKNEDNGFVKEIQKLATLKMGMRKFEKLLPHVGFCIAAKQAYVVSPNHIRFGLKPLASNFIAGIPLVGELLITGVVYLLKHDVIVSLS